MPTMESNSDTINTPYRVRPIPQPIIWPRMRRKVCLNSANMLACLLVTGLSRPKIPSRGGSHAAKATAHPRAWEPALPRILIY